MANESGIEIPVRITGEEAVSRALQDLTKRMEALEGATRSAGKAQQQAQKPAQNLYGEFSKLNGTVTLLAQTTGNQAVGAMNAMIGSLTGMGAAVGPAGIAITGLTIIIGNAIKKLEEARDRFKEVTEEAKRLRSVNFNQILSDLQQRRTEEQRTTRLEAGEGTSEEYDVARRQRYNEVQALQREIQAARDLRISGGMPIMPSALGTEQDPLSGRYRQNELRQAMERLNAAQRQYNDALARENELRIVQSQMIPDVRTETERSTQAIRENAGAMNTQREAAERARKEFEQYLNDLQSNPGGLTADQQIDAAMRRDEETRQLAEINKLITENIALERQRAFVAALAAEEAEKARAKEQKDREEAEAKEKSLRDVMIDASQSVASASILAGSEFIKNEKKRRAARAAAAALEAAFETGKGFAAIGDGNIPGAVAHFTAAAKFGIAAGLEAAAPGSGGGGGGSTSSASPERSASGSVSSGKSNTYVINFGAPVLTAATLSELGLQIQRATDAAQSRYGS